MTMRDSPEVKAISERFLAALSADGFRCVYQGGHHSVYCNGSQHRFTNGGSTRIERTFKFNGEPYKCNCARWGNVNGNA